MSLRKELSNVWKNLQEVDLRPIRREASQEVMIALIGAPGAGKQTLAKQLRTDHNKPQTQIGAPVIIAELDTADQAELADLIILLVDANNQEVQYQQFLLDKWVSQKRPVVVFFNKIDLLPKEDAIIPWIEPGNTKVVYGSALDPHFLQKDFANAVMDALPESLLALGRRFPLLRDPVAWKLIADTSVANAAYSLGTGLAEIVPILDIPLNVADIIVLTKAQALLVYKLGLSLGLSTDWQYYVAEFGGVLGGGFLWRQIARMLIGLVPIWGIVPKIAVAYSGTYVVGHAVLAWYQTGRHISQERMRELSRQAFDQGKILAQGLVEKAPRPKLKIPRLRRRKPKDLPLPTNWSICPTCGAENDEDAHFCKNCGDPLVIL